CTHYEYIKYGPFDYW
nr:immunoglobulin heavy chain junction region [Macaca mulatta]MOW89293.1 immunoglobulin heavy chain junction region [Macaca mulatta]MOW90020.1 immunoglobulin heavy chain junction region [Macaca mulatta]MOW91473.1 immunoglobulin heavy chain junction region [Macaca mulatta]MOW92597.1 immunoglobulin heavy chain junction region [Macaca mulatta]